MEINVEPGLVPYHFSGMVYRPSSQGLSVQNQRLLILGSYESEEGSEDHDDKVFTRGLTLITNVNEILKHYPNPESTIARMLRASFEACSGVQRHALVVSEDIEEALKSLPEKQFTQIASSFNSVDDLLGANRELEKRWDCIRQIDGHYFVAVKGDVADLCSRYEDLNSLAHVTVMAASDSPSDCAVWAATLAAVNAKFANKPYLPYQSLPLTGVMPPASEYKFAERDLLLKSGISTHVVESSQVKIDRLLTMHSKDPSLRDLNKKQILSFLRYDFTDFLKQRYPRHALSRDDTQASGDVATPKSARDLAIARHLKWKKDNYVQDDGGQFKKLVRVWIDDSAPETLKFYLPVQLMGQLRRTVTTIAFTP